MGLLPRVDDQEAGEGTRGSHSEGVNRMENNAQVAAGGVGRSRSGGMNHVENHAQVATGGAGGSRSEGGNQSVENNSSAQVGNRGARGNCGACRGNDKIKIKVDIELSTDQFIQVAHVLPLLGSSANTEK